MNWIKKLFKKQNIVEPQTQTLNIPVVSRRSEKLACGNPTHTTDMIENGYCTWCTSDIYRKPAPQLIREQKLQILNSERIMKTKDEIEEKASEYVEDVKDRIDSYAYLDVQEAFAEGAKWMQEQVNGDSTSYETALNIDVVMKSLSVEEQEMIERGKKHWSLNTLSKIRGGYMNSETIKELIDKVIENTWTQAKVFYDVVGQSEQLTCPRCKSTNCLTPDNESPIYKDWIKCRCCMGCANWRYTQNGMGECKILKQYTDEGFDCKAWMAKGYE